MSCPQRFDAALLGAGDIIGVGARWYVLPTAFDAAVKGSKRHAVEVDGRVLTKALDRARRAAGGMTIS